MSFNEGLRYGPLEMSKKNSPFFVVPQAAEVLDLYFKMGLPNTDYLGGDPLTFIGNAKRGLVLTLDEFNKNRNLNQNDLRFIISNTRGKGEREQEFEAFRYSLVVFSAIPDLAQDINFPFGFSRRGNLEPPFTTREFHRRLVELELLLLGVTRKKISSNTPLWAYPSLQRATQFFQVGKDLSIRLPSVNQQAAEEGIRSSFENLLGDTTVDI